MRRSFLAGSIVAIVVAAVVAGGCGSDSKESDKTRTVERTKVEVVEGLGDEGSFNPAKIYDKLSDGVVTVTSLFGSAEDLEDLLRGKGDAGQGSGFVLDEEGFIATNAHVITSGVGDKIEKADEVYVQFADDNQVPARIVGFDPNADIGLIKVDPEGLDLVPLKLAPSGRVSVGEPVAAIGSPFGEVQSLSVGVVSATDRTIGALTDFQIGDAIQTDAAINRGNSGGPLLSARGQVIGINSQIRSSGGGSEGVGFAVSIATVRRSLARLRRGGKVRYAFLGVSSQPLFPQLAERLKLPVKSGILVVDVVEDGPADDAGVKGGGKEIRFQAVVTKIGGDVITKVAGLRVGGERDLASAITGSQPGDKVTLELMRGGKRRTVQVRLEERPDDLPE